MSRRRLSKVLGVAMLAMVGAMALGASAAQANWLIVVNGQSVNSIQLAGTIVLSSELLAESLGFSLNCEGGTGQAELKTVSGGEEIVGSGVVTFTGCVVVGFEEVCNAFSPGKPAGTITASGSGKGSMEGGKTFTELTSEEFTVIEFSGEECPLTELNGVVSGTGTGTLVNAEVEQKVHAVEVDAKELFFGAEPVDMHGSGGAESNVEVSAEEIGGQPWSIRLVGL